MSEIDIFSNPLVPCDAISIPQISLYPWKEGYGYGHPAGAPHHAPYHGPVHHVTPTTAYHPGPVHHVTTAPYQPQVQVYHPEPTVYQPSPTQYSPAPANYGGVPVSQAHTQIKPFVHSHSHRFSPTLGK